MICCCGPQESGENCVPAKLIMASSVYADNERDGTFERQTSAEVMLDMETRGALKKVTSQEPVPAQPLVEPGTPSGPCMKLGFSTGNGSKYVSFEQRPLGLAFAKSTPVVVSDAIGYAVDLGISIGWTLESINDAAIGSDFTSFFGDFTRAMQALPEVNELLLTFSTPRGERAIKVLQRPVFFEFRKQLPVIVESARGHAAAQGIAEGFELISFGTQRVDSFTDFASFYAAFQQRLSLLPKKIM